ncbi:MAG: cytochrome c biogenesis protein CcsA [Caldilinea sp.]|nr:cytochrome c biogenesis protein CcsA [Caldilinea sp.]MCB9114251.1 cytochrome c biogenesis protein CcsA [Caldilineaceae bacterium]MCB9120877.1 cytochrome c biogenesis protein CcsA [Caldilineaceae bacterium]MCB9123956.1 cytochrome c biogenesis protein CcsA [Caldilineaceae bacterium]MCO5209817.1 cytochrome c biogenesis protein CcsA [Caldilinea sp.]
MSTATIKSKEAGWRGLDILQLVLSLLAVGAMGAVMWASLFYARDATNLAGDEQLAQRIFYIHMGCNIGALAGFLVSMVGSIAYLITRNLSWDRLSQAAIEVGVICGLGTIVTGMFWAKPTWNTYWTWDPRLTTSTITVLVYLAYLLFRNGIDNRQTRARFGSIYAILAFLSVPLTFYSARLFRSIHPVVYGNENPDAQGGFSVGASMTQTLMISIIGFCILFSALVILRWRQLGTEDALAELREDLE